MGNRQYYNLVIYDRLQQESNGKIADKDSIVCLKDYMQVNFCTSFCYYLIKNSSLSKYESVLDDLPAYVGGRSNQWRKLNLSGNLLKKKH